METLKQMFVPNGVISKRVFTMMVFTQVIFALFVWTLWPSQLIPKPTEVLTAFGSLWSQEGLGQELIASFKTNLEAVFIATTLSLILAYLTVIPFFRSIVKAISIGRFQGLVGLTFFFTLATGGGHKLKVSLMVFGLTVFFVTTMMAVVASVPEKAYNHARTLRMSRIRTVWEVVIRGKMDEAFEALRQNAAIGWMMLSMVEGLVRSEGGVGSLLLNQNKHLHLAAVAAIQLTILGVGLLQDYVLGWIKIGACPWSQFGLERR